MNDGPFLGGADDSPLVHLDGMTKLDRLAAAALTGLLSNDVALEGMDNRAERSVPARTTFEVAARDAFRYAEAMLAESERRSKA